MAKMASFHIVICQVDGARAHTGKDNLAKLNNHFRKTKPKLLWILQPAQSPDLNCCDLGLLRSLTCRLPEKSYDGLEKLEAALHETYDQLDSSIHEKIWSLKRDVLKTVVKTGGGNNFAVRSIKK